MPIYYNSQSIIPAPFVTIVKRYETNDDGTPIGTTFVLTLRGTLVSYKGSPNAAGTFHTGGGYPSDDTLTEEQHFPAILRKQEAIRELFSDAGKVLQIQPYNGAPSVTCNPRVIDINFTEGNWYHRCEYTVTLEADVLYANGTALYEDTGDFVTYKVSKSTEDWVLELADDKFLTYRLTHNVSAVGKRFYNDSGVLVQEAYLNAKDYVLNKISLGIDMTKITSSQLNLAGTTKAYNYARAETYNVKAGSYSVSETWLVFDPGANADAVEEFVINSREDESGRKTVTVDGTITGLQISDNDTGVVQSTKITNATSKFNQVESSLFSRAQSYSGFTLNGTPLTKVVVRNVQAGIITYTYTYDDRPSSEIPGSKSESIAVTFINPTDVFAKIGVLARPAGPILQAIGSTTESIKNLTIEAVMPAKSQTQTSTDPPNTTALVATFAPVATQVFLSHDVVDWNPWTGRYSRKVAWTYQ